MMDVQQGRIIGLFGMKGSGKTTLTRYIIRLYNELLGIRAVIYDTDYEDLEMLENALGKDKVRIGEMNNYGMNTYFIPDIKKSDNLAYLNESLKKIRAKHTNILLVVRDLDVFFDANTSMNKSAKELKDLSSRGRHTNTAFLYESKQPKYIPKKLISNTDLFFISQFAERDDIRAFKSIARSTELISMSKTYFIMIDRLTSERQVIRYDGQGLKKIMVLPQLTDI